MSFETGSELPEHEGQRYLELLGMGDAAYKLVPHSGNYFLARDFLDHCGDYAGPALKAFENMSTNDPNYEAAREALRAIVGKYVQVI